MNNTNCRHYGVRSERERALEINFQSTSVAYYDYQCIIRVFIVSSRAHHIEMGKHLLVFTGKFRSCRTIKQKTRIVKARYSNPYDSSVIRAQRKHILIDNIRNNRQCVNDSVTNLCLQTNIDDSIDMIEQNKV